MSSILSGGSPLEKGGKDTALTDFKRRVAEAINDPGVHMLLLQPFMEYVTQYQALNQVPIPISQIFGFAQTTANFAYLGAEVSRDSTTFGDPTNIADPGPSITGLPDGNYIVLFGGSGTGTLASNVVGYMAAQANGESITTASVDEQAAEVQGTAHYSVARAVPKELSAGGNNTVKCVYASSDGTALYDFRYRWIMALRYSNL